MYYDMIIHYTVYSVSVQPYVHTLYEHIHHNIESILLIYDRVNGRVAVVLQYLHTCIGES